MAIKLLVDRSGRETQLKCDREFYLRRLYAPPETLDSKSSCENSLAAAGPLKGLQPKSRSLHLPLGQAAHLGLQALAGGKPLTDSISEVRSFWKEYQKNQTSTLLTFEQETPQESPLALAEARDLSVALTVAWARTRQEQFLREFEVVAVEPELQVPLYSKGDYEVILQSRPDLILRRRDDGTLFQWELKTKGTITYNWIAGWEHNLQLIGQTLAVREWGRLNGHSSDGAGAIIEALVKGTRRRNKAGIWEQQSPLIYAYQKPGSGGGDYLMDSAASENSLAWEWKKNWRKVLVSTLTPLEEWVGATLPFDEVVGKCQQVPSLVPSEYEIEEAREEWGASAILNHLKEQEVLEAASEKKESALRSMFPKNTDACFRYGKCKMYDACWNPTVASDPLGSGLFEVREPHHPAQSAVGEEE